MKILSITPLAIPDIKIIRFARFRDNRGFFTEPFRQSDIDGRPELAGLAGRRPVQVNESYSRSGVVRGLHFQWNPFMGKLVRTVSGRMVDIVLDIRKDSLTLGKALLYDMPEDPEGDAGEWIWVPPGFAHGNFFTRETRIEYFCTGEYSPGCEAGISPWSSDIDWSLCGTQILTEWNGLAADGFIASDKDRAGLSLAAWLSDPRSDVFYCGKT